MNAIKDKRFLNCGIQGKFFCSKDTLSDEHKKRIGESWTDDRKISSSEDWKTNNPMFKDVVKMKVGMATRKRRLGAKTTEETRTKISESLKGRCLSESHKKAISESKKGDKNPMYGKKISKEAIENRIEKTRPKVCGENHWTFGKTHSDEYKKRMSESLKKSWQNRKGII